MNLFDDPILIAILVVIGIATIGYVIVGNKHLFVFNNDGNLDELLDGDPEIESPLAEIFYLYNHKSAKDWLRWLEAQNQEVKAEAFKLLAAHLSGPSKFWGYITIQVLGVMHAFKEQRAEEVIGNFTQEVGRLWGEYKSIPNYYKKAIDSLIEVNPMYAMQILNKELDKNSSGSQAAHDKKKIIIDSLSKLEDLGVAMMITILNDNGEAFIIKAHALRVAQSFSDKNYKQIILETLKKRVRRGVNTNREIKAEDSQLLQDLLKEGIKNVGQYEFFKVIREACDSPKLQPFIINPLITRLHEEKSSITPTEVYAMTLLRDNEQGDLRRAICKLHALESIEINNICTLPIAKSFSEEDLKFIDLKESRLFIPSIFKSQYDDFKALFFQSGSTRTGEDCEKNYGGILVTGNDKLEKLYFSKAFAKEKAFNFGYIDLENIVDKESYASICNIFSTLRKPYILFIDNPELMFPVSKSEGVSYREKFSQALYIQALDLKSLLVGSINKTSQELNNEETLYAIDKLRKKFFAQMAEINKKEERFKPNIVEDYFKFISNSRFSNKSDLIHELVELGKEKPFIEFTFFVLETLAAMLMVFGRDVPYSEIQKLKSRFVDDPNQRTYEKQAASESLESDDDGEKEEEEDSTLANEA